MIKCYAGYTKSNIINQCSSGGIYAELASLVIKNGGIVYASVYDKDFNVKYDRITDYENLKRTFGAKYVQSDLGNSFKQIREDLINNTTVLFCGLPCQVAGLKSYLCSTKINEELLYTIDLFCHGEPSAIVWEKYYGQNLKGKHLVSMNMRSKDSGWKYYNYSFKYEFKDEIQLVHNGKELYMKGYLENLYTKPACCNCMYKSYSNESDITLGDFWGVDKVHPEIDDTNGVSSVIVNTEKGNQLLENLMMDANVLFKETTISNIMSYDSSYVRKVSYNPQKYKFLRDIQESDDINFAISKYIAPSRTRIYLNKFLKLKYLYKKDKKENRCLGCSACVNICPKGAITLERDCYGFLYPVINTNLCIKCKKCYECCVIDNDLLIK